MSSKPSINKNIKTNNNKKRVSNRGKVTRAQKRRIRQANRRINMIRKNTIPMAMPRTLGRTWSTITQGDTSVRVRGCDLIYKIPDSLAAINADIMTIIPANPAYWSGTRIAALAQGYQNYRPLKLNVKYCPQCPVTQQGNVIAGTLWCETPSATSYQQSLKTSNGGFITPCYKPATSVIRMKSNLQLNLYRMGGDLDQTSNPFIFVAIAVATLNNNNQKINPGYFFVEYDYLLKNPIGSSTVYVNTGIEELGDATVYQVNTKLYTCEDIQIGGVQYPPGTPIDVEFNQINNTFKFLYNGSEIPRPAVKVWQFGNQPGSTIQIRQQLPPPEPEPEDTVIYYTDTQESQAVPLATGGMGVFPSADDPGKYEILINTGNYMIFPLDASVTWYANNIAQPIEGPVEYRGVIQGIIRMQSPVTTTHFVSQNDKHKCDDNIILEDPMEFIKAKLANLKLQ